VFVPLIERPIQDQDQYGEHGAGDRIPDVPGQGSVLQQKLGQLHAEKAEPEANGDPDHHADQWESDNGVLADGRCHVGEFTEFWEERRGQNTRSLIRFMNDSRNFSLMGICLPPTKIWLSRMDSMREIFTI